MIKLKNLIINEELIGELGEYEIYKNPKSIKRMKPFLRGYSFPNGDLYVVDDGYNIIHSKLAGWLKRNGYGNLNGNSTITALVDNIKNGYITWQREANKNVFKLGESIEFDNTKYFDKKELMPYIKKYTNKVRKKNSQYKFILKRISND